MGLACGTRRLQREEALLRRVVPDIARPARVSDRRVMPDAVVEPLDIVEHVRLGFVPGAIDLSSDAFGFQRREEAFHGGIVPDVARPAHAAGDATVGHQALELVAGILGGFKRSSQHQVCSLTAATRQAPLPAFSSPKSFSVGH